MLLMRPWPALIVVLFLFGLPLLDRAAAGESRLGAGHDTVTIATKNGRQSFAAEIANTKNQRDRGLMFRRRLPERRGMLFDFDQDQEIRMWMKNTLIPLDMIFIQSDGRIRKIEQNTEPGSLRPISSDGPARAVLEVRAGTTRKYGIAPGDRVIHPLFSR